MNDTISRKAALDAVENTLAFGAKAMMIRAIKALPSVEDEIADLKASVIAFAGPHAVQYGVDLGLPRNHLHPTHYDILESCGARMDDFTRADIEKITPPATVKKPAQVS